MKKLLPYEKSGGPRRKAVEKALVSPRAQGILIVDDDGQVRSVMRRKLRQKGFAVWVAANGRNALHLHRRHRAEIDVILLDLSMPSAVGSEALAAILQHNGRICCSFMSADASDCCKERLRNLGVAAVLEKPLPLTDAADILRQLADQTALSPSNA